MTALLLPEKKIYVPSGDIVCVPGTAHLSIEESVRQKLPFTRILEPARLRQLNRALALIGGAAAGNWTFTDTGRTSLINGTFDIDTDVWKMALFLSTSNLSNTSTTYAALTNEVAAAFGYSTGGMSIALTLAGTTTVTVDITTDPVWTASGGSITARYAVLYEVSGNVLCYALLDAAPADVTATAGNTLTVAANVAGVFTLA